ncbi:MAG TPA: chemotaxis protein CheB [Blastocatellia bacterium]|nr:chemotaxis protein CheB [Blastocatellia bacterium]
MINNSVTDEQDKPAARDAGGSAFDVVAIASSAGGLAALSKVLSGLPKDFPAAIVIVQHLERTHRSMMAEILSKRTGLDVVEAKEGDLLRKHIIYIAPPDRHLLVNPGGVLSLSQTELVHFVRPSADVLFQSVAASYEAKAIAVVLTGSGSDGEAGIKAIKKMGGKVMVQDEDTSAFFGMPGAAIATGCADYVLPLEMIPRELVRLVTGVKK